VSPLLKRVSSTTFAALEIPNYRLYVSGQAVSLTGTWMQAAAQSWLVLKLTDSATALGLIVALQTLPILVFGPYGGVIADRVNKRRAMIALQAVMGIQALILGLLTVTNSVTVWEIAVLAFILGLNNAFENPARQSFMMELVGSEHLRNAVSLNSTMVNVARVVGPAVAGVMIALVGTGWCFLINSVSFIFVISSLTRMDMSALNPVVPVERAKGQLREGLRYVRREPRLLLPLVMAAIVGCFAYEFQVTIPYMASHGLHVGATGYGFMSAAMGVGAVVGGLAIATRGRIGSASLIGAALAYGVFMTAAALAPSLPLALVAFMLVGAAGVAFMSQSNATLQMRAAPEMRGRVMALWFVSFQGSTPIGGPIVGAVMSAYGARAGLGLGAVACFVVAFGGFLALRSLRGRTPAAPATPGPSGPATPGPSAPATPEPLATAR
jgi:MFS family permease